MLQNSQERKEVVFRMSISLLDVGDKNRVVQIACYLRKNQKSYLLEPDLYIFSDYLDTLEIINEVLTKKDESELQEILKEVDDEKWIKDTNHFIHYLESIYYLTYRDNPEYRPELLKYSEEEILDYIKQADPLEIENYNQQNPENKI